MEGKYRGLPPIPCPDREEWVEEEGEGDPRPLDFDEQTLPWWDGSVGGEE